MGINVNIKGGVRPGEYVLVYGCTCSSSGIGNPAGKRCPTCDGAGYTMVRYGTATELKDHVSKLSTP
jgi:hypothetical protein